MESLNIKISILLNALHEDNLAMIYMKSTFLLRT